MKKFITVALVALGFVNSVNAQGKGNVEFGLNVGVNFSNITNSEDSAESSTGFNVGGSMDYYFSDRWSIKGKLIYDRKGWDDDFISDQYGNLVRTDINVDYLTIPVMANWHFGSKRNWYLHFGPYVGILVSAKETRFETDVDQYLNSSDFGLAFGIGVKVPVSDKIKVFFEYDGQSGFSDVLDYTNAVSANNSRSAFNVGLNFIMK